MANYECATRTNYFHVKDPDAFREFMSRVYSSAELHVWEETEDNNNLVFCFGLYGCIDGYIPENEDDEKAYNYDDFLSMLQQHVAEDDAVIVLESGNEKLRYVVGSAIVITTKNIEYFYATDFAVKQAASLLGNPNWTTKCEY